MNRAMQEEIPRLRGGFEGVMERVEAEFAGLTEEQMTFCREEPVWARWSAERQLRHMAKVLLNVPFGWFREHLEERSYRVPEAAAVAAQNADGPFLAAEAAPDRAALYAFMRPLVALHIEIIERETPESLRATVGERYRPPDVFYPDSPERSVDFWRTAAEVHPFGVREDTERPGRFEIELGAALRQIYWELLAHLRTVQRLKGLLGLPPASSLPREGYLALSKFYD